MQFKVPQNVQREDTIIGPLTLRQLIICGIGGGIAYTIYISLAKEYFLEVWLPPVLFVSAFTVAFAFVKIHNLTFFRFLLFLILFTFLPKNRTWQKGADDILLTEGDMKKSEQKGLFQKTVQKKSTLSDVEHLSKILDSHGLQKS